MTRTKEVVYKYRWIMFGVAWTAYTVAFLQRLSIPPLAPFLRDELHLTHAEIGLLISAAAIGYLVTQLPSGWLVDRIGARWLLLAGQVVSGACLFWMSRMNGITMGLVIMALVGLGCGCLMPASTKVVMSWFPLRERATVMGLKQTGVNIGGIVAGAMLPAIALTYSWNLGFMLVSSIAIGFGIISFALYREPTMQDNQIASASAFHGLPRGVVSAVFLNRNIVLLSLTGALLVLVEMTMITYLVEYLREILLFSVVLAGGYFSLTNGIGAFGKPLFGVISDRLLAGRRKSLIMLSSLVSCALCVVIVSLSVDTPLWIVAIILATFGLVIIGWGGLLLTLIGEFAGKELTGTAIGFAEQ